MATRAPQDRESGFHVTTSAASASSDDAAAQLEAVIAAATRGARPLAPRDRRRLLNPRTGWEALVPVIAALAERYGLGATVPIDEMNAEVEHARGLRPVLGRLALVERTTRDAIASSQSRAWSIATSAYTILSRLAVTDARLAVELEPVVAFFALGKRPAIEDAPAIAAETTPVEKEGNDQG